MDPSFSKILEQAPWVAIVLYLWQKTTEERREWRMWFEAQQNEIMKVIEANTAALTKSTEALGEANAARLACPAAEASRFQRGERSDHHDPKGNGEER